MQDRTRARRTARTNKLQSSPVKLTNTRLKMGKMMALRCLLAALGVFLVVFLLLDEFDKSVPQDQGVDDMIKAVGKVLFSEDAKPLTQTVALVCVKKCGSGYMKLMVGKHPSIYLIQDEAPYGCWDVPALKKAVKEARLKNPNRTILISNLSCMTTPDAFDKLGDERPQKLVFLLCDPVKRAFSDYHNFLFQSWDDRLKGRTFGELVNDTVATLSGKASEPAYIKNEGLFGTYLDNLRFRSLFDLTIVSRGVYVYDLAQFLATYPRQDVMFVTGKQLIDDPAKVMLDVQRFAELPKQIDRSNFIYDPRTDFYCMAVGDRLHCLGKEKSRTTGEGKPTPDTVSVQRLENFYQPYNEKLKKLLGFELQWK